MTLSRRHVFLVGVSADDCRIVRTQSDHLVENVGSVQVAGPKGREMATRLLRIMELLIIDILAVCRSWFEIGMVKR